ncbi:acetyltransferase [Knoellia sp. CPCC 206453]|uniref:acetyltransferase n=1 Tax=Knoellia pratensis TaxID=3404796 RepID=UPI0036089BA9
MKRLAVCGSGGFGREVLQIVAAINAGTPTWELIGVLDDAPTPLALAHLNELGVAHLGAIADLTAVAAAGGGAAAVVAIGDSSVRHTIASANPDVEWAVLVHPDATVGPDVTLADGAVIAAGARLSTNIRVGKHVHVDQNVTVGHDSTIGAFSRLNPQACVSGAVTVGEHALVGANATILQGLTIGSESTVGAGAVVVRDVSNGITVKGVPAR